VARSQGTISPDNSPNSLSHSFNAATGSLAAGDYSQLMQHIEGLRADCLQWGTANAVPAVLRFSAACQTAGTYSVAIQNAASDYTWLGSFTCDGTLTMKTFSFAVPAQSSGTWPKDNTIGLSVRFCYAVGTTYGGGVAGWQAAQKMGIAGQTNGAAVANKSLLITDVGLYPDPERTGLPPPFIAPMYDAALRDCLRYWERQDNNFFQIPAAATAGYTISFGAKKRTAVTISFSAIGYSGAAGLSVQGNPNIGNFDFNFGATAGSGYATFTFTANARM
jgi:hypothetical protein